MKDDRVYPGRDRQPKNESFYESDRLSVSAGYERDWQWGLTDFNYYFEQAEIMEDNSHPVLSKTTGEQTNHNLDGKVSFDTESQRIILGFDYSDTKLAHPRDYAGEAKNSQFALYAQDEISFSDPVTLTLSGRYTHHSEFGDNFSPRAYLVVSATDNLTIKGGGGAGFKAPAMWRSSEHFSMPSCRGGCLLIGNPELKPETSLSYEVSAMYHQDLWFARATLFNNKVKDMIARDFTTTVRQDPSEFRQIQHINLDEVKTRGVEMDSEFELSDTLYLKANATYTQSKDVESDSDLNFTPKWLANVSLDWAATQDASMFVQLNHTGTQINWDKEKLEAYEIVNFGGKYYVTPELMVNLGVSNLFDKRLDTGDKDYGYAEIGRTFYASLGFDF